MHGKGLLLVLVLDHLNFQSLPEWGKIQEQKKHLRFIIRLNINHIIYRATNFKNSFPQSHLSQGFRWWHFAMARVLAKSFRKAACGCRGSMFLGKG
jgi:hypothetical protein